MVTRTWSSGALRALAGATAESATELTRLLGVPDHAEIARLSETLLSDKSVTLKIASSIWLHKTIKDDYILTAQSAHKAVAAPLGTSCHMKRRVSAQQLGRSACV